MSLCDVRFVAIAAAGLLLPAAFAQRGSTNNPATRPPTVNTPGNPSLPGGGRQQQIPQPLAPEVRPIYLSGRVMLDDGTPPPDTVAIQTVCSGMGRTQAFTDSKGRFSFEFGDRNSAVFQDASVGNSANPFGIQSSMRGSASAPGFSMERIMQQCDIEAKLPGYQSEPVSLVTRRASDNPEIGTIILHRIGPVEGTVISATSLAAPKPARKAFEKGLQALKNNKPEDAAKHFQTAVEAYPEYATAWLELGKIQASKQPDEARKSFEAAIKAEPKFTDPYLMLALVEAEAKQWSDLAQTTDTMIRLNPYDYPQAFFLNAVANYYLRNLDAAEKSARQGEALDKQHRFPKSWHVLGAILAERRDYAGAAEQLRAYLSYAPQAPDAALVRHQLESLPHQ